MCFSCQSLVFGGEGQEHTPVCRSHSNPSILEADLYVCAVPYACILEAFPHFLTRKTNHRSHCHVTCEKPDYSDDEMLMSHVTMPNTKQRLQGITNPSFVFFHISSNIAAVNSVLAGPHGQVDWLHNVRCNNHRIDMLLQHHTIINGSDTLRSTKGKLVQ